jgi:hypothetical protein
MVYFVQKMYSFCSTLCIFWGIFFSFHLVFWETLKMYFWHKSSNTILVIFQMIVVCQKTFMYSHIYACLDEKPHLDLEFFIQIWNGTMTELICNIWLSTSSNFLSFEWFLKYICTLQYINTIIYFFINIFPNHLIRTSKWDVFYNLFLWVLKYLIPSIIYKKLFQY